MTLEFLVEDGECRTLEQYLRREKQISRRLLVRLKHTPGGICCNGAPIRTVDLVKPGDHIVLTEPETGAGTVVPAAQPVPVAGETAHYVVYDKPPGMPVHPSQGHHQDTLANVFAAGHPGLPFRPVYRLDRDTSGLCLAAKSAYCAAFLQGKIQKRYLALVCGRLTQGGTITAPIGREEGSVIRRCVRPDGKPAVTHYTPLSWNEAYTLVSLTLETGRTHQIRVHMASIGFPLAGDDLYGGSTRTYSRHMLHCTAVTFPDPETGQTVHLTSPFADAPLL